MALSSLTANYTDSEGEEEKRSDSEEDTFNLTERLKKESLRESTPGGSSVGSQDSGVGHRFASDSNRSTPVKKAKLVSYHDETILSDEEREAGEKDVKHVNGHDDDNDVVPMELESDEEKEDGKEETEPEKEERNHIMEELWSEGVKLPPEPTAPCSKELQEKIEKLWEKKQMGMDMNSVIQNKKAFRNPSIYAKLIQFCDIDELGTNFPPELYDGHLFGRESQYDELGKAQKVEMDKREKAHEARKKLGEAHALHHKKNSKWDQAAPGGALRQPGLAVNPLLGQGKVIPAFGSLKKK